MNGIFKAAAIAVITVTAFVVGLYIGLNDHPKPVEGLYNIEYSQDTGRVVIVTRIKYIEQDGDTLTISGKPTFNRIK